MPVRVVRPVVPTLKLTDFTKKTELEPTARYSPHCLEHSARKPVGMTWTGFCSIRKPEGLPTNAYARYLYLSAGGRLLVRVLVSDGASGDRNPPPR